MGTITVGYWHLSKFADVPYKQDQEFDNTPENRTKIVETILSLGYAVMLKPQSNECLHIWIDKGRFGQR